MAALKEWSIVCKALEEGRQVLLLRKGGIMEYRKGFELKHENFFLFPTFEHQDVNSIQSDYQNKIGSADSGSIDNTKAKIDLYAQAFHICEIRNDTILPVLRKYHIWNDDYVKVRMKYNPTKALSVVLLKTFRLENPISLDVQDSWAGCKSWIPVDLTLEKNYPVYSDNEFNVISSHLKEVMEDQ